MDNTREAKQPPSHRSSYLLALRVAGDFGVSIAMPALIAAYVGVRLDERFGTKPWLLILLLVIAFTLTAIIIVRKAKAYGKMYERM